ncbi:MAG: patatin-like protein [Pseudomonadota bacterium]
MREKELRLALVCYGGISLAVYMHGITREIWKLLRASRALHAGEPRPANDTEAVYYDLLTRVGRHVKLRVLVDIIAGASAGGINGIFLAEAISSGRSLDPLVDLWLEKADVDELLDPDSRPNTRFTKLYTVPLLWYLRRTRSVDLIDEIVETEAKAEVDRKLSSFVRSRWFRTPFSGKVFSGFLLDALGAIRASRNGPSLLPNTQPLDLYVTVTDFAGHPEQLRLNSPELVSETEHRKIIAFRDEGVRPWSEPTDADPSLERHIADCPSLAFAARATASFPGAFPPFQTRELDAVVAARDLPWDEREPFLSRVFSSRSEQTARDTAALLDGSILNNAPFRPAISALRERPAHREIDRRFVYIDPKPGGRSIGAGAAKDTAEPPGFFTTILRSLSDIPREQPIRDDLEAMQGFSRRVRRMRHVLNGIAESTDAEVVEALGERALNVRPSVAKLAALRARANAAAVERAGYAYPGYAHLKLAEIVEGAAATLSEFGTHCDPADRDEVLRALWAWVRAEGIEEITRTVKPKLAAQDRFVGFLQRFDLGYRTRRLRYVARHLTDLVDATEDDDIAAAGERAKETVFAQLSAYIDRAGYSFFASDVQLAAAAATTDPGPGIEAYGDAMGLEACDERDDAALADLLADKSLPKPVRRTVLNAWLGFAFYDIATFPILQGEGLDEYNEIKVDRISPDDAQAIRKGGAEASLKGTRFNSFGAFFSRVYRENDYLWGRLHGADRLVDIVLSTLPRKARLDVVETADLKGAAFHAILDVEEPRLTKVADLIAQIRGEIQ